MESHQVIAMSEYPPEVDRSHSRGGLVTGRACDSTFEAPACGYHPDCCVGDDEEPSGARPVAFAGWTLGAG
jgi:hypothetical protein